MDNCPRCKSAEIKSSDNYCKICGLDLKEAAAATTAPKVTINVPDGMKTSDVIKQIDKFTAEYVYNAPLNS